MFNINKIKEALGIAKPVPQSVDTVLGKFTQTLADLDTVQATQAATSTQCTADTLRR